jgi:hypothetical protein
LNTIIVCKHGINIGLRHSAHILPLKGQCHKIFASGFFMNQFPPSPRVSH